MSLSLNNAPTNTIELFNDGWCNGFPTTGHFIALINRTKSTLVKSGRKNWVLFCIPSWLHVLHRCQDFLQIYWEKVSSCTNWCCFHWYNRFSTLGAGPGMGVHAATLALRWMGNKEPHNFGIRDLRACRKFRDSKWLLFKVLASHVQTSWRPSCFSVFRYAHMQDDKLSICGVNMRCNEVVFSFPSRPTATVLCGTRWMQTTATAIMLRMVRSL